MSIEPLKTYSLEEIDELFKPKWYHHIIWPIRRFFDIPQHYRQVKWFIQRGCRGYADIDTWNFGGYVMRLLAENTRILKDIAHGYPARPGVNTMEEWQEVLEKMHKGFALAQKIWEQDAVYDPIPEPMYSELKEYNIEIYEFTDEDRAAYDEAFDLFKEWQNALWD